MSDITNQDRMLWAEAALGAFTEQNGGNAIEDCYVSDLIADLGHYCDAHGIDFLTAVERGIGHWKAETVDASDCNRIDLMPAVTVTVEGGVS